MTAVRNKKITKVVKKVFVFISRQILLKRFRYLNVLVVNLFVQKYYLYFGQCCIPESNRNLSAWSERTALGLTSRYW